ncbi:MAG: DUF2760 domain-containing protein [Chitinivibrionales bacterium]
MKRLDLALRSFFWILFNGRFADKVNLYFVSPAAEEKKEPEKKAPPPPPPPPKPSRNDAVTLLALLQREARLVDFLKESLDGYSDQQIGAAVRDVHRDSAGVLERVFKIQPLASQAEGDSVTVEQGFDPEQYRFTGNLSGEPPYRGTLQHHGWKATKCELPVWKGSEQSVDVVAPAEVELP